MRIFKLTTPHFIFLSMFLLLGSCEKLGLKDDPCDDTVKPEIAVQIQVDMNDNLKGNDTFVEIDIYKVPCGAARKGDFHFEGFTYKGYYQQDYVVNYNLRNTGDKIKIEVKATSPWAKVDLYQTLEYSYADFYDKELKYPSLYFEFLE